jgi:hypothetical protein
MTYSCVGLFCEDIREEVSGSHTIIGVMPDNITLAVPPSNEAAGSSLLFPKMGVYLRVHLEPSHRPAGAISARVSIPGIPDLSLGELGPDAIEKAFADSVVKKFPLVGIIFKAVLSPLQITEPGLATAFVKIEEKEIIAAMLNIQIAK